MKTSEQKSFLCSGSVRAACLVAALAALCVFAVMLISYARDSQYLRETKKQYEEVRKEYKAIAEKNDPSIKNKAEPSNNEIKRKLAGLAEDEDQEIRETKFSCDIEIDKRLSKIESFLSKPDQ